MRTMTAPSDCLAMRPVSREIVRPPMEMSRVCMCLSFNELRQLSVARVPGDPGLLADAEALDQIRVAVRILALQIIQEAAALADQLQEAAARVVILGVRLEMFGQIADPLAEERDLHFRGARVAVVSLVAV